MWEIARRPRWIGGLFLCLAIAAIFALLGQWQISRSIDEGAVLVRETETVVPIAEVAQPQAPVTSLAAGQRVSATGEFTDDYLLLAGRLNGGEQGYWVISHLVEDATAASLAVATGWAPTVEDATAIVDELTASESLSGVTVTGRYLPSEAPQEDDFENGIQNSMSVAAIINQWQTEPVGVYGGYLILDSDSLAAVTVAASSGASATAELTVIDSVPPSAEVRLNWLNVFYAIEWVVFAVFAVFLWFRLVRDAYQREQEDAAELN
jgi:surfeit locus 1 family protein